MAIAKLALLTLLMVKIYADSPEECNTAIGVEKRDICEITSAESGTRDDEKTSVSCPDGYSIVDCMLVQGDILLSADGVEVTDQHCEGQRGSEDQHNMAGKGVKVKATCQRSDITNVVYVKTERVNYTKEENVDAELWCPPRYTMRTCLYFSGWNKIVSPNGLDTKTGKIMVVQNKCNMTIVSTHDKNNVRWFTLSAICTEMDAT
ncbi:hypothetical protein ACHWQZ_G016819 [Mnemiopsis leidyi]